MPNLVSFTRPSPQILGKFQAELFQGFLRKIYFQGCSDCFSILNWIGALIFYPLLKLPLQGLIEKNNLSVGNVNTHFTRYILGYYTLYRLRKFMSKY